MQPYGARAARAVVAEIAAAKQRQRSDDLSAALTIISQRIYAEETHFLLELIQNAEDAGATEIAFVVQPDGIVAGNDGRRFDAADVRAIASVGKSTKSTGGDYIGFFGIGFKSVFKISDAPRVYSGDFRFAFDRHAFADDPSAPWQIVPLWVEAPPPAEPAHATAFVLPFARRLDEAAISRVAAQFDELDPRLLLFLRRLRRITVDNRITGRRLAVERRDDAQGIVRLRHGRQTQRWRVFRRTAAVPPEVAADPTTRELDRDVVRAREVVVACGVDAQGGLVPTDDDRLFVFLPTMQHTGLSFLVQGDFLLTAQRDRVQPDALWNRWLAGEVVTLLLEAIAVFREHPRWRTQFFDLMPLPGEVGDPFFHAHVERALLAACRTQPVGLAADGTWRPPPRLVLAEEPLRALLDETDLDDLFGGGLAYAAADLSPRAQMWLGAVGTQALATDALLQVIGRRAWLERRARVGDAAWFARLYQTLHFLMFERYERQGRRYEYMDARAALAEAAFVYTSRGTVETPYRVLFPLTAIDPALAADVQALAGLGRDVTFVHPRALETATPRAAYRLLADCGVRYANSREVVERWLLPLYESDRWQDLAPERRDALVRLVFAWWATEEIDLTGRLAERLAALRLRTSAETWERADRLYLSRPYTPEDDLAEILTGVPYVSACYLDTAGDAQRDPARWAAFLRALGAAERPRVRSLTFDASSPPAGDAVWWTDYLRDVLRPPGRGLLRTAIVEGLDTTLAAAEPARLLRLAHLLAIRWDADFAPHVEAVWLGEGTPAGPAAFVYLLRDMPWLPTTLGLQPPPAAYTQPTSVPTGLLADLLPLAALPGDPADLPPFWQDSLGVRPADDPAALLAALLAVPERLAGSAAVERAFALYSELQRLGGFAKPAGVAGGLRLPGVDGAFHACAALYVRDDERVYAHFRERVVFAATPPGEAPHRYAALLRSLGVPSARAHWHARVVTGGDGSAGAVEETSGLAGPSAHDQRTPTVVRDADAAGQASHVVTEGQDAQEVLPEAVEAKLRVLLRARQRRLASIALHAGKAPLVAGAVPLAVLPRLVVHEALGNATLAAERNAFCAGDGEQVYVRAAWPPAWLELAEALAVHWDWPRETIVVLRLALTAPEDEVALLFRLQGIALV